MNHTLFCLQICSDINKPNGQFCLVDAAAGITAGEGGDLKSAGDFTGDLPVRAPPVSAAALAGNLPAPIPPPPPPPVTAGTAMPRTPPGVVEGASASIRPPLALTAPASPPQAAAPVLSPTGAPAPAAAASSSQAAVPQLSSPAVAAPAPAVRPLHRALPTSPSPGTPTKDIADATTAAAAAARPTGTATQALAPAPGNPPLTLNPPPLVPITAAACQPVTMVEGPGAGELPWQARFSAVSNGCISEDASDDACRWDGASDGEGEQGGGDDGIQAAGNGSGSAKLICSSRRAVIMAFVDTLPVRKVCVHVYVCVHACARVLQKKRRVCGSF
eukprot:1138765-Pelagomonas_calceolata.AAC.2